MIFLAILSGLINLSAQTVFQKVVSMTVGDLYTTFMAVMLTFIVGSAIGSYFGHKLRRFLPWIELCSGVYSFLVYLFLTGPFYARDLPLPLVIVGLILPALALGTHIPLYSYYLRQIRFGWIYGLYHWGAILGLIAFEWHFVHAGSVKNAVLFLALCQCTLGLVLIKYFREDKFHVEAHSHKFENFKSWLSQHGASTGTVFLASTLSFYGVLWGLKTQTALTEAYRLHATLISAAVFIWMSLAGLLSTRAKNLSRSFLFLGLGACFLLQQLSFQFLPVSLTDLFSGSMENYFGVSLILALYLTLPVLFSSLIFINETAKVSQRLDIDQASGGLNLFASSGNILGFVVGGIMAPYFWHRSYLLTGQAIAIIVGFMFLMKIPAKKWRQDAFIAILVILTPFAYIKETKDFLFINRTKKELRPLLNFSNLDIYSHAFSSIALLEVQLKPEVTNPPPELKFAHIRRRQYIVDGHFSHDILSGLEIMSGIASAKYFERPLNQSMVIGVGSGQAAWAVSAISQKTDLVEISPTVLGNLKILKEYNNNLHENENLHIYMQDGFSFARNCKPGTYDLILNTSTYPSNFNASKLYSDEFVELAKKCLAPEGVFQTYFDYYTVVNMDQFYDFLAPLMKHFKYVDVMNEPYPQVFAYNTPRKLQLLNDDDILRPEDKVFYKKFTEEKKLFPSLCQTILRDVPRPLSPTKMNTLDQAYLEAQSLKNMVQSFSDRFDYLDAHDFYQAPEGHPRSFTCE